ncbi:semaphorin-7A [Oryzias melastigma]|uniref:Semaphorin 7A (JohnMiltonHagen blood group) n=1 Tax=Oryzias melastigma TaxID=30732 RepID=A0A3B3CQZ4_ORYME|nr:semaphorin-7A [Oryzias melastigma]
MTRFLVLYYHFLPFTLVLGADLKETPILGSQNIPRLLTGEITDGFKYQVQQNHSVFFKDEDSEDLYVGGSDFVYKFDMDHLQLIENITLKPTGQDHQCIQESCQNVVTVIEKFNDNLLVCAANGLKPQCWDLSPSGPIPRKESGISPFIYSQNSLTLVADGDLYAAAPLGDDGGFLQFRRIAGNRTNVWMHDSWVSDPTFISASLVKRTNDPDNEKMYIFFRERNSDHNPEADPWISRIARVCKVDEGGSKRFFQNKWTSFLKARLVCGFPEESLYFNRLQDIYVLHAENWHETRVYALFTSSWNSTAVCIYSMEMIENVFENSSFRGYEKDVPQPRPGTCVVNSQRLPWSTISVVRDHPEMTGWVHSIHQTAPFYISNHNYTKIVVDRVQAADQREYNIMLLTTDNGKIHKVLEAGSEPFIISQTQISNNSSVQAMKLDSKKKKLVVGFSEKISTIDLEGCNKYDSCEECVLARDPYCSWTFPRCTPTVPGGIQNIVNGSISVCPPKRKGISHKVHKRDAVSSQDTMTHTVPLYVPFYLSCPIHSYHAEYTWKHHDRTSPCLQMHSNCLHLIPSMSQENYGTYECVSTEKDYSKVVKTYKLEEQIYRSSEIRKDSKTANMQIDSNASGLGPPVIWLTLLSAALWEIF